MRRVVAVAKDRVVNPTNLFERIDAGLAQRVGDEHFDQAFFLAHADPTAAELAHVRHMLRAVPFEKRRVAPTADDIHIVTQRALVKRRFDVDGGGDVNAVVLDRQRQAFALERAGNETAGIVLVFFKAFLAEVTFFLGDGHGDLMADVIVAVGDQNRLIERAHACSFFVVRLLSAVKLMSVRSFYFSYCRLISSKKPELSSSFT